MRVLATLLQGNQEPLVAKDKVELGVSKSMECDTLSLECFDTVGWTTGRASACKKLGVGLLMMICLELCTS